MRDYSYLFPLLSLSFPPRGAERGRLDLSGTFMSAIKSQNGGGAPGTELGRMRRSGEEEGLSPTAPDFMAYLAGEEKGACGNMVAKGVGGRRGRIDQVWKPLPLAHRRRTRKHDTYVHRHEKVGGTPRH